MCEREAGWRAPVEAMVVVVGLCVFALLAHRGGALRVISFCGLGVAAMGIAWSLGSSASPSTIMGVGLVSRKAMVWIGVGCALGVACGMAYRVGYGRSALPARLTGFVVVAAAVGAVEELVYRGYVQGRVCCWGAVSAVVFAAAAHTAYKTALFALPPDGMPVNYPLLIGATLGGGLVFGAMRERSGSVLGPLASHAVFDILAYGDWAQTPWWVWS